VLYDELLDELRQRATQAGSVRALAAELDMDGATLHRWLNGQTRQANLPHLLTIAEKIGWTKTRRNKLVEEVTDHLPARTSQADMTRRLEELEQRVIEQGATLDRLNGELAALLEQLTPRQQSPHP
jgi:hypothetical protein